MYYTSTNKEELELYNMIVSRDKKYDGISTKSWANIIEHKEGNQFAILANPKYSAKSLNTIENLDGWFEEVGIM